MTALSDIEIVDAMRNGLVLGPLGDRALQPASVEVRLMARVQKFRIGQIAAIDPTEEQTNLYEEIDFEGGRYILHPGEFVVGSTVESMEIPADIVARLEGKSSLARYGLQVHSTAGFIDPGFQGTLTLELSNVGVTGLILKPDMKIGHLSFWRTGHPSMRPYGHQDLGSKYQGQYGPTVSRYHRNYEDVSAN